MKNILKSMSLVLVICLILVSLTGCGSNKLVATKTTEDDMMGNYKEKIIMKFKNDKVTNIEMNMEFDKEETASSMYAIFNLGTSLSEEATLEGIEVKQDGKKLVVKMDANAYSKLKNVADENMTKDALKAALAEDGYTVK